MDAEKEMTHQEQQQYYKERAAKRRAALRRERQEEQQEIRRRQEAQRLALQQKYMRQALGQARKAYALGEVPIGCVIVKDGVVIGRGYNRRNTDHNTLAHAEITAINRASKKLGDWRLEGCTLYVTLEPCQMCAGAIVQARVDEVVMGCKNPKAGCAGSILNLLQMKEFNHQVKVTGGILEEECSRMLKDFFKGMRLRSAMEENQRTSV